MTEISLVSKQAYEGPVLLDPCCPSEDKLPGSIVQLEVYLTVDLGLQVQIPGQPYM